MNQRGFSNIILIGIAVIFLGIGGYFVWSEYGPQPCAQSLLPAEAVNKKTGEKKIFAYPCAVPRGWIITDYHPATTPSATNQPQPSTLTNNVFSTNLNGYFETCMDTSAMYKHTNGSWEKVSTKLPGKGLYYLDNKFVGYGMCDVVVCTELPKPYTMQLVEYKKVGEKAPPSDSGSAANTLPVYQTVSLSGDVKIDIQYFGDKNCQNKKTFSTVLKR